MADKLLVWDIDGTLIQGRGMGRKAMTRAFLELYGIQDAFKNIEMSGRVDAFIIKEAYKLHQISAPDLELFFNRYCFYLQDVIDRLDSPIEAPGIQVLLETLKNTPGFFNVLGTGNIEKGARLKLSVHNMNRYFAMGGFGDKETERIELIRNTVEHAEKFFTMKFASENVYVIGDTPIDIACGRENGFKSIGVATGLNSFFELSNFHADYVFENFSDTFDFLTIFE